MQCPSCQASMDEGLAYLDDDGWTFLLQGFTHQHLWFKQGDAEPVSIARTRQQLSAYLCAECQTLEIPAAKYQVNGHKRTPVGMSDRPITPTNAAGEAELERIAVWLDPGDIQWLAARCCCSDDASEEERQVCARLRFRASAALHKTGFDKIETAGPTSSNDIGG